jgi:enoyl-CoA hydratase/carnithine racemase
MNRLDALPLTTIGAIHGACFGGGFELALTCDLLIADKSARFCFPELRLGLLPGFGGIPRLKRDVGNGVVRDLLLTGRSLNAKKAQTVGLVSQMVGQGKHLDAARAAAKQATRFDADAARTTKAFIKKVPYAELEEEKAHFKRLSLSTVTEAALKKFVESKDLRPYLP